MAVIFDDMFQQKPSDNNDDDEREITPVLENNQSPKFERNVSPGSVLSTHTGTEVVLESDINSLHTFNTDLSQPFDSLTVPYFSEVDIGLGSDSHLSLNTLDSDIPLGFDSPTSPSIPDVEIALESDPPISLHTLNSELTLEFTLPTYTHSSDMEMALYSDSHTLNTDMSLDFGSPISPSIPNIEMAFVSDSHITESRMSSESEPLPVSQTPETTENEIDSSPGNLQDNIAVEPQSSQTSSSGNGSRSSSESEPDTIVLHTPESHVLPESDIDASSPQAPEIDVTTASESDLDLSSPRVMTPPVDSINDEKEIHSKETNDLTPNTKMEDCVTPDFGESSKSGENKIARRKSRQSSSSCPQPKRLRPIRTIKIPPRFTDVESITKKKKNIFEVEQILDKKLDDNDEPKYLIKWLGYDSNQSTWEPKKHLKSCKRILKEFEKKLAQAKRLKRQQ